MLQVSLDQDTIQIALRAVVIIAMTSHAQGYDVLLHTKTKM